MKSLTRSRCIRRDGKVSQKGTNLNSLKRALNILKFFVSLKEVDMCYEYELGENRAFEILK